MIKLVKILFVCRGNIARSQIAEALYNKLSQSHDADSAGTHVEKDGETLGQRKKRIGGSYLVDMMADHHLDVSSKQQTQLTKAMLSDYDLVINMAGKHYTPTWLAREPNYVYWKVQDPAGRSYEITERIMRQIEAKVRELIIHDKDIS